MNKISLFCALVLIGSTAFALDKAGCASLKDVKILNNEMIDAVWNESGEVSADRMSALTGGNKNTIKAKPHCVVHGKLYRRVGSDGKEYGIDYELRLPEQWNEKFLFQGGGGMDGFVVPALGAVPIRTSTATPALLRGYAVVTTNSGHPEPTTEFGLDQQARLDYLDGLKDGIINAWEACKFDPKSLNLAKQKIAAIEKIFNGAKNSKGEQIYSGWFYDSGVSAEGWRQWKLGDSQSAKPNARNITL